MDTYKYITLNYHLEFYLYGASTYYSYDDEWLKVR